MADIEQRMFEGYVRIGEIALAAILVASGVDFFVALGVAASYDALFCRAQGILWALDKLGIDNGSFDVNTNQPD